MWRQGDIFISKLPVLPEEARSRPLPHVTLAHGELTGHSHRVDDPSTAALFAGPDCFFLEVHDSGARIVHDEHGPIWLDGGFYRVWRQREYTPQRIVNVVD
jgi:hypothetical protein